ncbi:hypothetical protein PMAYCL1PPCAC_10555, partial [Pristionchus mayeri]
LIVNAYCLTPGASCRQTQTLVNGICLSFAPGSACQASGQCIGGSKCTNNVCTCPSGKIQIAGYCILSLTSPSTPSFPSF